MEKAWSGSWVESSTARPRAARRLTSDSTTTWLPKSRLAVGSSMTLAGASWLLWRNFRRRMTERPRPFKATLEELSADIEHLR